MVQKLSPKGSRSWGLPPDGAVLPNRERRETDLPVRFLLPQWVEDFSYSYNTRSRSEWVKKWTVCELVAISKKSSRFAYHEKTPDLSGVGVRHLMILNPSKNGVSRFPTYHVKSFWKIPHPETKQSITAFSLDFVVGVSHPHELNVMSPCGLIVAMRLPCNLTSV